VHATPVAVDVVDGEGRTVGVTGRGLLTSSPARVGAEVVTGWAGPWLYDERWWVPVSEPARRKTSAGETSRDAPEHRRRARFQMTTDGGAYLVAVEGSRWFIEAVYD
jgi:protein ImuB